MSKKRKRRYDATSRAESAGETRRRILAAAKALFARRGLDQVTIHEVATRARTSVSTVYATYKSKDGILRALMQEALFGPAFQSAQTLLTGVTDPARLIERTAHVSRAIYEGESGDLGLLRHASGFSPALRRIEQEFERLRFEMQEARVRLLFQDGRARHGLSFDEARRILWTLTSREVYTMLVADGGWTPDRYQDWLSSALLDALVERRR